MLLSISATAVTYQCEGSLGPRHNGVPCGTVNTILFAKVRVINQPDQPLSMMLDCAGCGCCCEGFCLELTAANPDPQAKLIRQLQVAVGIPLIENIVAQQVNPT